MRRNNSVTEEEKRKGRKGGKGEGGVRVRGRRERV